jgi:small GTP-binding protein
MILKKICMLGSFAVGKTSLVRRYVESIYSDKYQTTVGVKIMKKVVQAHDSEVTLVLWDIYGEDDFQRMRWSSFNGASGYLLVADGTRRATFDKSVELEQKSREEVGPLPFVFVINKHDRLDDWEFDSSIEDQIATKGWTTLRSSAKTGENVDQAFSLLLGKMMG